MTVAGPLLMARPATASATGLVMVVIGTECSFDRLLPLGAADCVMATGDQPDLTCRSVPYDLDFSGRAIEWTAGSATLINGGITGHGLSAGC